MLHRKVISFLLLFSVSFAFYSFTYDFREKILWQEVQKISISENDTLQRLSFNGAFYNDFEVIPRFFTEYPIHTASADLQSSITNYLVEPVSTLEKEVLLKNNFTDTEFKISSRISLSRKIPIALVEIIPVRWNATKNIFEKLISFEINIEVTERPEPMMVAGKYTSNSVLTNGEWFKIRVDKSGMFKLTYEQLQTIGFNAGANPSNIAVFGNGGGVLSEQNDLPRLDDLVENPIEVVGGNDGSFGPGDYLLFYAQGPVVWKYQYLTQNFRHQTNYYDDYSYYYVTVLDYAAKRVTEIDPPQGSTVLEVNEFTDFQHHEIDKRNLAGTGRIFYGEMFDFNSTYEFSFNFPNTIKTTDAKFYGEFASMSSSSNSFQIFVNNDLKKTLVMQTVSESNIYQIARKGDTDFSFVPSADDLVVKLIYKRTSNSASGYLNFFDLNVKRQLVMAGDQMMFRERIGQSGIDVLRYRLENADKSITVWDISDPVNAAKVKTTVSGNSLVFDAANDTLRQFVAFSGQEYFVPEFVEKVANQNLHALKNIDYVIIAHPDFLTQANKLADFHRSVGGMDVFVTTHAVIANEFASGSADITGIRDFMKMLYDVSDSGKEVKYLLLFGDASYDYKGVLSIPNSNFVSTWESTESWNIVNSVASDDYYGYLDDGEGNESANNNKVDIGIGRFVVTTQAQADMAVNKSIYYATNTPTVMAPWRNMITFVADDGDNNLHMSHGEQLSDIIETNNPVYNIDKIYVDAYKQISTPAGQRAPDVNQSINDRMEKGTLIVNYNGHGGEIGWGHEQFLQNADITSWTNYDHMPIFITATCEFSRYDDPTRVSAGELVFLNNKGGAVALFSTARATFASSNLTLNKAIYENNIFEKEGGEYPCFGDIIRKAKKQANSNDKKFILIGDPALKLAYPEHKAKTISINGKMVSETVSDTINALSKVTIVGEIVDANGNKLTDFNGIIYPTIYDKKSEVKTFGDQSNPTSFLIRKNVLFNGQASIDNGDFSFEYIVPKDIAYKFGDGRISYYFRNETEDGNGYYDNLVIGGYDQGAPTDNDGPEVRLFMNDTTFQHGGTTNENPVLLAIVSDESGINTTGNGIGHDIIATLDEQGTYTLNNYYEAQRDSYKNGKISYPLSKLSEGQHTISLKVWDIYNNSTTAAISFTVVSVGNFVVENLINYPNPFSNETSFVFDHNQAGQTMQVNIRIYSLDGKLVRNLNAQVSSESYQSEPIVWNATNEGGSKISPGMYMYKVVVQNENGSTSGQSAKLIYLQ